MRLPARLMRRSASSRPGGRCGLCGSGMSAVERRTTRALWQPPTAEDWAGMLRSCRSRQGSPALVGRRVARQWHLQRLSDRAASRRCLRRRDGRARSGRRRAAGGAAAVARGGGGDGAGVASAGFVHAGGLGGRGGGSCQINFNQFHSRLKKRVMRAVFGPAGSAS